MRFTKKSIILLAFSVILMVLGLWNYVDANPVTYDVIASSVVLIVVCCAYCSWMDTCNVCI